MGNSGRPPDRRDAAAEQTRGAAMTREDAEALLRRLDIDSAPPALDKDAVIRRFLEIATRGGPAVPEG